MGELNLDEIKPWLAMCGGCDAGIGSCTHPEDDYRPVMADLLAEVERLRSNVERTREWVRVADAEDVTDWQRGYRACSDRALHALAGESDG